MRMTDEETTRVDAAIPSPALRALAQQYADQKAVVEILLEELEGLKTQLVACAQDETVEQVPLPDGARVTVIQTAGASRLDKHRLVELGVDPALITAATGPGTPSVQVRVWPAKGD